MSETERMYHTDRSDIYTRDRRRMTPRQYRRYFHKINRAYADAAHGTPRRADARAAMLERRRG